MTKLSTIQNLVADVRKLTIGDMLEGEFSSAHEAYEDYHCRIQALRTQLAPIIDDIIEDFFISHNMRETVGSWLDLREDVDEDCIWRAWEFLNPND